MILAIQRVFVYNSYVNAPDFMVKNAVSYLTDQGREMSHCYIADQ
jgi:hypothetical protein